MKVFVARFIRFIVYSHIFIALCTTAYAVKTALLISGSTGNIHVTLFVFSATLLFYCFHPINKKKFITSTESNEERIAWMNTHTSIYYILIAASLLILTSQFLYLPIRTWVILTPVALLGLGYTFPFIPTKNGRKRLRDIYWLKPLWISIAFSTLTSFLPIAFSQPLSTLLAPAPLFIFFRSILFIFALCIPFDIRDMQFDKSKNIRTLPVIFGPTLSIYIAIILLLLFISLICIQFLYFSIPFPLATALFLSAIITIFLLLFAKRKIPQPLYSLLYDGSMMLQAILVFLAFNYLRV